MIDITFDVAGLSDLQRALAEFPAKIEKNILRGALRAGVAEIQKEARAAVPVDTGLLRDSIRVSTGVDRKRGVLYARVRAGGVLPGRRTKAGRAPDRRVSYAHLVEFGTAAHYIQASPGSGLAINGSVRKRVRHPGARKTPFMRMARDRGAPRALSTMAAYLRERIPREAAR